MTGNKRWLEESADPGARALRQAMDEARPAADDAFAKQRVWARVQAPWWDASGKLVSPDGANRIGWLPPLLAGAGVALVATVTVLIVTGVWRSPAPSTVASGPAIVSPSAPAPEVVLTTGSERTRRQLAQGVAAELSPRTALVAGDVRVAPEVKVGRVRFSVPHQPPGQRYRVRAGEYQVVVLGTVFDVAVDERGVAVAVENGTVEVQVAASGQVLRRLTAGDRWSSSTGDQSAAAPPPAEPVRRGVRAVQSIHRPAPRRLAIADAAGARALDQAGEARWKDPARALALYRKIVDAGGPLAETALYEMAVVQDEDLHDPRQAAATWQRYRDRYPKGLLRAEADLSTISVLSRLGDRARSLQEARGFLDRHPGNERRAEVARVAGDLARTSGDCRSALGFYDLTLALVRRPLNEDADDARFYRAVCLADRGDGGAADALRSYLGEFPLGRHAAHAQRLLAGSTGRAGGP